MKRLMIAVVSVVAVLAMLSLGGLAQADFATAYVGTANANNQFEVMDSGNGLYFNPQPDTTNNWYYQDGSLVTYLEAPRDGMKTYAATSVGYGSTLGLLSLSLDYVRSGTVDTHGTGLIYQGYPNMNIAITDGIGTYAIWSATSGGTAYVITPGTGDRDSLSMDLTALADDSVCGKVNESTNEAVLLNGKLNETTVQWSDIKDWKVAGFYNEQFNPTGGFGAWNETLWSTLSIADDPNTTGIDEYTNTNPFGIYLFWGDTVGSMYGDGDGEIGLDAERPYGKGGKEIANFVVGVGATSYTMSFESGVVPEPATMAFLALGGIGMLLRRKRSK